MSVSMNLFRVDYTWRNHHVNGKTTEGTGTVCVPLADPANEAHTVSKVCTRMRVDEATVTAVRPAPGCDDGFID
jgi:hypothetical protein